MSVATNGLCPAGRATLEAHDKRLESLEDCYKEGNAKMDRITWLLVTTLTGVVVTFGYMVLGR